MAKELKVANKVTRRNHLGRFISELEAGGTKTIEEAINRGQRLSTDFAPQSARERDPRTVSIVAGMGSTMLSSREGSWGSTARHTLHQEYGTRAHLIQGNPDLTFFWEKEGRMFWPVGGGHVTTVHHPGHGAQPFLRPAYKIVMREILDIADRNYPG